MDADTLDPIVEISRTRPSQQKAGTGHPVLVAIAAYFGTTRLIDNTLLT